MNLESTIEIDRPIEAVFAFLANMQNVTLWTPVKEVHQMSDGPMGEKAMFVLIVNTMGQKIELVAVVTAYEPPHTLAFKVSTGPLPLENTFTLTPSDGATQLTAHVDGDPSKLDKMIRSFINALAQKQMDGMMKNLKKAAEQEHSA